MFALDLDGDVNEVATGGGSPEIGLLDLAGDVVTDVGVYNVSAGSVITGSTLSVGSLSNAGSSSSTRVDGGPRKSIKFPFIIFVNSETLREIKNEIKYKMSIVLNWKLKYNFEYSLKITPMNTYLLLTITTLSKSAPRVSGS